MTKGIQKQLSKSSTRQIPHTRLTDDDKLSARYEILDKLGEGSFGTVYRVQNKESQLFYAVKTIPKKPGSKSKSVSLDNEVKLLTEVNHPNLIQLHEVLESPQNLYLVIELCEGGELGRYVKTHGPLPEPAVKQIMLKLINALHYLHKIDVVHRDLKLENILLKNTPPSKTDEFDIRVTDFGLSSKKSITSTEALFTEYCGTPLYMAPEILENKNYSALCDVWAMGIVMYYLICGRHPYVANDERRLLEVIRTKKLRFDSEKFENLSSQGLDFLQGMLVYDTVHRRAMGELIVHPWLTGRSDRRLTKDIITMMKEFHAEDSQRQLMIGISLPALINATAEHPKLSHAATAETAAPANPTDSNPSLSQPPITADINKLNALPTSPRASNEAHDTVTSIHARIRPNDLSLDVADLRQSRQTHHPSPTVNSTKLRMKSARMGRSQSQVDRPSFTQLSLLQQQRRAVLNGSPQLPVSPSPLLTDRTTPAHTTSTVTALMMINREYTNLSTSSQSSLSARQRQQQQGHRLSVYDKRPIEHV